MVSLQSSYPGRRADLLDVLYPAPEEEKLLSMFVIVGCASLAVLVQDVQPILGPLSMSRSQGGEDKDGG